VRLASSTTRTNRTGVRPPATRAAHRGGFEHPGCVGDPGQRGDCDQEDQYRGEPLGGVDGRALGQQPDNDHQPGAGGGDAPQRDADPGQWHAVF